jgi:hypothetical protein
LLFAEACLRCFFGVSLLSDSDRDEGRPHMLPKTEAWHPDAGIAGRDRSTGGRRVLIQRPRKEKANRRTFEQSNGECRSEELESRLCTSAFAVRQSNVRRFAVS